MTTDDDACHVSVPMDVSPSAVDSKPSVCSRVSGRLVASHES